MATTQDEINQKLVDFFVSDETCSALGVDYSRALKDVLETRIDRRKQYGDTFMEDDDMFLRFQIENKLKRLKLQFEDEKVSKDAFKRTTAKDSLIDLVNYAIFLIAKMNEQDNKDAVQE